MSKYHNHRYNGFDSTKEAERYSELCLLQRAGKIMGLERQVKFELIPAQYEGKKCLFKATNYYADFTYYEDGEYVVEDVKGYKKGQAYAIFTIKKKLMYQRYKIKIRET